MIPMWLHQFPHLPTVSRYYSFSTSSPALVIVFVLIICLFILVTTVTRVGRTLKAILVALLGWLRTFNRFFFLKKIFFFSRLDFFFCTVPV